MGVTDWDEWMKAHHIKIYTEEQLQRKKLIQTVHKAVGFMKQHKAEIVKVISHASET